MSDPQGAEPIPNSTHRLVAITFDTSSIARAHPNIEHEREVAIFDILENNHFALEGRNDGPYQLVLGLVEDRLVLTVTTDAGATQADPDRGSTDAEPSSSRTYMLSLTPMRRIMKDYFLVCETYYQAIRTQPPSKIQAIDMGRRALHDEGSRVLVERLAGKIGLDHDTSRRLFTLICALHWKG